MELPKNYKLYKGDARIIIPQSVKEGYNLFSMMDVMDLGINYRKKFPDIINDCFDTIDAVAYNEIGDVKIIRNSKDLLNLNQNSILKEYALSLSNSGFEELTGDDVLYLPKKEKEKIHGKDYTLESVKNSEEWNFLARENSRLVKYADMVFPEIKRKFGYEKAMKIHFDSRSDFNKLRTINANGLLSTFDANAWYDLGASGNKFIGVKKVA